MPRLLGGPREDRRTPPEPAPVDLGRVVRVGMAVWALALVVTLVLAAVGSVDWRAVWVCVAGVVLGVVGLDWVRRHPAPPATASGARD